MKYWVGVTDESWYRFLSPMEPDEVNFWQPSGKAPFTMLGTGTPFLFKLKRPHNHIAGLGYFLRFTVFPVSLVWEAFGEKNGQPEKGKLLGLLKKLRHAGHHADPSIGCSILTEPVFFPQDMWIPVPKNWASNIVRGKIYNTDTIEGLRLWNSVQERLAALNISDRSALGTFKQDQVQDESNRYGSPYVARQRLGQGSFRLFVTDAYERRCAITGERTLPVLEAAHIKPFSDSGPHVTSNGLLLRSDFHTLFDRGLVTVTPELDIEVSALIRKEWFNGKAYYGLHGRKLAVVPAESSDRPQRELLAWHNENIFLAS